jgi:3-oxoadipate enol-lactonase
VCVLPVLIVAIAIACSGTRPGAPGPQPSARPDTGTLGLPAGPLFYEVRGTGPAVVLLHGAFLDHRMWDEQVDVLARSHTVVRYDLRPFGRSRPAPSPWSPVDELAALLAHLRIVRADLVGLSLGGQVAVDIAIARPELVERLVLVSASVAGWRPGAESMDDYRRMRDSIAARGGEGGINAFLSSAIMRPAMQEPERARRLRQMAIPLAPLLTTRVAQPAPIPGAPALGRLGAIRAPTLAIVGTRDVGDMHAVADTIVARVAGARKVLVADAGHMVNMERPAELNRILLEFLKR